MEVGKISGFCVVVTGIRLGMTQKVPYLSFSLTSIPLFSGHYVHYRGQYSGGGWSAIHMER